MNYNILSIEQIGERYKYRVAVHGIVVVLSFKNKPSDEELEKSVNRLITA